MLVVTEGVILFLLLVLKVQINAFISLLITDVFVGIPAGIHPERNHNSIPKGYGETLGFIAVAVGLGAIFGQIRKSSGDAHSLAN